MVLLHQIKRANRLLNYGVFEWRGGELSTLALAQATIQRFQNLVPLGTVSQTLSHLHEDGFGVRESATSYVLAGFMITTILFQKNFFLNQNDITRNKVIHIYLTNI